MAKPSMLYRKLLKAPRAALRFRDIQKLVVAFGFVCVRTRGSHRMYEHPQVPRPLILQPRGHEAKAYQQQEFLDMVEDYSLRLPE
jgi:predicted RNA binding protein YcfA (HicA-like mRNA interferase family)